MDRLFGRAGFNVPINWGNISNEDGKSGYSFSLNPIVSMVILTIMIFLMAICVYVAIKKSKVNVAPPKIVIVFEQYVYFVDDLVSSSSESKLDKTAPYFFSLFTYLAIGNALAIFGLAPLATSLTFVFTITAITWIATIVVGIIFQKWHYLKEWRNPLDWIGKVSPLLSLSFRMFGNITGGAILMILCESMFQYIWRKIFGFGPGSTGAEVNILGALILPWLSLYFDIFDSILQAFVFVMLTITYWSLSAKTIEKKKSRNSVIVKMKNFIKKSQQETTLKGA